MNQDEVVELLRQHVKDNYSTTLAFLKKHGVSRQSLSNMMCKKQYPTDSILNELGLVKKISVSFEKSK